MGTALAEPGAVAVDRASGDVFVGDPGSGMVDVYSSSGVFLSQFGQGRLDAVGVAVAEASGLVYVADASEDGVLVFEPSGGGEYRLLAEWFGEQVPGGEFGAVSGVAVDNSASVSSGDVYVVEGDEREVVNGEDVPLGEGAVDVFKPKLSGSEEGGEGESVRRLSARSMVEPNGVAVSGTSGRVLVADGVKGTIYAYGAEGVLEEKLSGKGSPYGSFAKEAPLGDVAGVAVEEASGDVYVAEAERHVVSQYSPSGEWEGWITSTPSGGLGEPRGVALTPSGEVFVADAAVGVVDRFGTGVVVPSVETGKVAKSALTRTTALLPGTINGEGEAAKYRFQYGETTALGSETGSFGSGPGLEAVSAMVEKLHAGTTYYYRIVGEDEDGANYGLIRELETSPAVEALETGAVKDVTPRGATLTGSLKREGLETHYYFQYGTSEAYGAVSPEPPGEVPAGETEKEEKQPRTVETVISGLQPNVRYHYRVVAHNSEGTTYGADQTFTTSGPPRITYEPVTGIGQQEATVHAMINPDQFATSYRVQYGETSSYGSEVSGGELAAGQTPVAVAATLPNVSVGRTYHFRIVASNEAGTVYGEDQAFTTVSSAPVDATYAAGLSSSEATLHTQINPLGHDTHYYFQYGTQGCQANPSACTDTREPPGADIGEGTEDVAGEAKLTGLSPGATYHYRVIDSNTLGTSEGPERTFTTPAEAALALADDRAWEMVSPPDKQSAPVEALTREGGIILASEDGNSLTYVVDGALDEEAQGNRSPQWQQALARREQSGWRSEDVATPSERATGVSTGASPEYQFFTPDLSLALVEPPLGVSTRAEPPLAEGVTQATLYLRDNSTGTYLPLVTEANTAPGTQFGGKIRFVSATADLSHVVLASKVALLGPSSAPGLYEWADGTLQLVSVRANGRPAQGLIELGSSNTQADAISSAGSRVIWTTAEEEPHLGHLYMRDTASGETVQLDAAQGVSEPSGRGTARFQTASGDGSRVFFTDRQKLTPHATAEPVSNEPDLYECEMVVRNGRLACELSDLSVDPQAGGHANVQGLLLGRSQDGTSAYFIAHGALASSENGNHEHAVEGGDNLYETHYDGHEWAITFIATLSSKDSPEWEGNAIANTAYLTARVSPNGRYLAFMSSAPLTGYDNVDANPAAKGARDEEVYLYDSTTASLRCVSCNPSGARPEGVLDTERAGEGLGLVVDRRKVWVGHWLAGSIPGWTAQNLTSALIQSRYLSDDGRLFFDSPDDLVGAAKNHKEDVYEYEPSGLGSCESATGGCLALLSGGTSDRESAFIEATPDGGNVFFLTAARLLAQDTDTAFDIYDARECSTSSPCLSPPANKRPGCAETETCRPAAPAKQIPAGPAGTASASGPGNPLVKPPPAKHGVESRKTSKPLTRGQRLANALESCRKHYLHAKRKRQVCERTARARYGPRRTTRKKTGKRSHAGTSIGHARKTR